MVLNIVDKQNDINKINNFQRPNNQVLFFKVTISKLARLLFFKLKNKLPIY